MSKSQTNFKKTKQNHTWQESSHVQNYDLVEENGHHSLPTDEPLSDQTPNKHII